jgi:hypothetical protein
VKVGDEVDAGAPLFTLDDRDYKAEAEVRRTALQSAKARLERLKAMPRPEEIPPAEARVTAAEAQLADFRNQVALWESVADKRAVTVEDLQRRKFAVQAQEARVAEAKAALALLKAGSWKADLQVAEAEVAAMQAQLSQAETEIARLIVRAPSKGVVLQVNVRAGEFAPSGALQTPLILFGKLERMNLRVDVDENDAWRFRKEAAAVAFVRGNRELKMERGWSTSSRMWCPRVAHRRLQRAGRHPGHAGRLQLPSRQSAGLRGPADGRLHRGEERREAVKRLAALLLLTGCSVGPDYERPQTPAPPGWGQPADTSTADLSAWWTVFRDDVLNGLVDRAVAATHDLRIAAARIDESRGELGVVRGYMLP